MIQLVEQQEVEIVSVKSVDSQSLMEALSDDDLDEFEDCTDYTEAVKENELVVPK